MTDTTPPALSAALDRILAVAARYAEMRDQAPRYSADPGANAAHGAYWDTHARSMASAAAYAMNADHCDIAQALDHDHQAERLGHSPTVADYAGALRAAVAPADSVTA